MLAGEPTKIGMEGAAEPLLESSPADEEQQSPADGEQPPGLDTVDTARFVYTREDDHVNADHFWWRCCGDCILFDWVYVEVWSRPLALLALLRVMYGILELALYNFSPWAANASCQSAGVMQACDAGGVPYEPAESRFVNYRVTKLQLGDKALGSDEFIRVDDACLIWLALLADLMLLNSKYLARPTARSRRSLVWQIPLAIVTWHALLGMLGFSFVDLQSCSRRSRGSIDWASYGPPQAGDDARDAASSELPRSIAEFCVVRPPPEGKMSIVNVSFEEEVKNIWAAWMGAAVFHIDLDDADAVRLYCRQLFSSPDAAAVILPCLAFLNSSALGNRMSCSRGFSLGLGSSAGRSRLHALDEISSLSAPRPVQDMLLQQALASRCSARVSGANFALGVRIPMAREVVSLHLLSLLARGLACPQAWSRESGHAYPWQADTGSSSTCALAPGLQSVVDSGGEPRLVLDPSVAGHAQRRFVGCVVRQVRLCEEHQVMLPVSWWMSFTTLLFSVAILVAFVWGIYVKLSALDPRGRLCTLTALVVADLAYFLLFQYAQWRRWGHHDVIRQVAGATVCDVLDTPLKWPLLSALCVGPALVYSSDRVWRFGSDLQQFRGSEVDVPYIRSWHEVVRILFSSRVILGLALATLMQASFTFYHVFVLWPKLDEVRAGVCGGDPYCVHAVQTLPKAAAVFQCAIVLFAVYINGTRYWALRKLIMEIPYNVMFGEELLPPEFARRYTGPDILDLREMARTSVPLAMQFPAMVFWHFFVASWLLVLVIAGLLVPILVSVLGWNPKTWLAVKTVLVLALVHFSDYVLRLHVHRCLMDQPAPEELDRYGRSGMRPVSVRCLNLFTLWEFRTVLFGLALGPISAALDLVRGMLTTALGNLMVDRPSFAQFGEFSDNVYCCYCAALYLERLREERRFEVRHRESHELRKPDERERPLCQDCEPTRLCAVFCALQFLLPVSFVWLVSSVGHSLPLVGSDISYADVAAESARLPDGR